MSTPSLWLSFLIKNLQSKTKIVLRHYYVEITQYILQTEPDQNVVHVEELLCRICSLTIFNTHVILLCKCLYLLHKYLADQVKL